jgi:hypothetical protein
MGMNSTTNTAGTAAAVAEDPAIRPYRVDVPEEAIIDLRRRIAATRWLNALPQFITHGWPGSVIEILNIVDVDGY